MIGLRYIEVMLRSRNASAESNIIDRLTDSAGWARLLMPHRRLQRVYELSHDLCGSNVFDSLLHALQVNYAVTDRDVEWVPKSGAAIVVANHPFGMLDGLLIGALLLRVRTDVKIIANRLLASIPELSPHCIYVEAMDGREKESVNARGLREAIRHLFSRGASGAVFPPARWRTGRSAACQLAIPAGMTVRHAYLG